MTALWRPRDGYPEIPAQQPQPEDRRAQASTGAKARVGATRRPESEFPDWAEDVLARPNPQCAHAEIISAPTVTRKARLAPPLTHGICDAIVRLRREWGISQTQLARIPNVGLRTVKRWEAHQGKPMERTRALLGPCVKFVELNGVAAFMDPYVREEPRDQVRPGASLDRKRLRFARGMRQPVSLRSRLTTMVR